MVDLVLTQLHRINGIQYGPGRARVPKDTGDILMEQERNFLAMEATLRRGGHAIVGAGNRLIPVNEGFFDMNLDSMHPAYFNSRVSGRD